MKMVSFLQFITKLTKFHSKIFVFKDIWTNILNAELLEYLNCLTCAQPDKIYFLSTIVR